MGGAVMVTSESSMILARAMFSVWMSDVEARAITAGECGALLVLFLRRLGEPIDDDGAQAADTLSAS